MSVTLIPSLFAFSNPASQPLSPSSLLTLYMEVHPLTALCFTCLGHPRYVLNMVISVDFENRQEVYSVDCTTLKDIPVKLISNIPFAPISVFHGLVSHKCSFHNIWLQVIHAGGLIGCAIPFSATGIRVRIIPIPRCACFSRSYHYLGVWFFSSRSLTPFALLPPPRIHGLASIVSGDAGAVDLDTFLYPV